MSEFVADSDPKICEATKDNISFSFSSLSRFKELPVSSFHLFKFWRKTPLPH
jgi:hypothetical protein